MNPDEFVEWLQNKLAEVQAHRNYGPNTKEENKLLEGKIEALNEVLDKINN